MVSINLKNAIRCQFFANIRVFRFGPSTDSGANKPPLISKYMGHHFLFSPRATGSGRPLPPPLPGEDCTTAFPKWDLGIFIPLIPFYINFPYSINCPMEAGHDSWQVYTPAVAAQPSQLFPLQKLSTKNDARATQFIGLVNS